MAKITKITLKNGSTLKGFYNGKNYNGTIYCNELSSSGIDWKHSTKINFTDIAKIEIIGNTSNNQTVTKSLPTTTVGWMREMELSER